MMAPGTATMVAATLTAATFGATVPSSSTAAREGWTPPEVQRAAVTAAAIALVGAAVLAAVSSSGEPLYVSSALAVGLGLAYQLSAGARVR